jgi:hypothetical protein
MTIADPSSQAPYPQIYKHLKTGHLYQIKGFAICERHMWPVVIYERWDGDTGQIWTRACHEFFDGRFVPRVLDYPEVINTEHQNDAQPKGKFGQ